MIRFTKNLLSANPGTPIGIDEITYIIERHNTANNIFMPEARKCTVDLLLSDEIETILNSSKIRVSKTANEEWHDTDYSVYQAEIIKDGNVKFTGLVDLNSLTINYKTREAVVDVVDVMAILAALRDIYVGFSVENIWVPWFEDKSASEVIENITGDSLSRCVEGDGQHYNNINSQINYISSGSSAFDELEIDYDWENEVWGNVMQNISQVFQGGYHFAISPGHKGHGFIIEDGILYFYRWAHIQGWIEETGGRDLNDYAIGERFVVYRREITMTLASSGDWWELGDWEEYFSHDESSTSNYTSYDPYWESLLIDPDWVPFFNSMSATMNYGIAYEFSEYSFFFRGFIDRVWGFLYDYNELLIPFGDAYETNNVITYSFPEIIKMALITDGVQLSCNNQGIIMFDKLDDYNITHNIVDSDLSEKMAKRVKASIDLENLESPFSYMGYEKTEGTYPEIFQAFISPIVAWFRALFSTTYKTEYSLLLFNDFDISISDKILYNSINYRIISFSLDENEFVYDIVVWGE